MTYYYSLHCHCTCTIIHPPSPRRNSNPNRNRNHNQPRGFILLPSLSSSSSIHHRLVSVSASSSTQTQPGNNTNNKEDINVHLHLRLDHQVEFGDHVVLLGSTKQLGSWTTHVPLNWTPNGWVCDFHFNAGDHLEFKFIIVHQDGTLHWESGDNRVLNLPNAGHFQTIAKWNKTHQTMELLPLNFNEQNNNNNDDEKEVVASAPLSDAAGPSPFVGEWQPYKATEYLCH